MKNRPDANHGVVLRGKPCRTRRPLAEQKNEKKPIDDVIADGVMRPARGWVKGKKTVYIAIGRPRPDDDPRGDWICPVFITKFTNGVMNARGVGPLDALLNAMNFLRSFFDLNTGACLEHPKETQPITPRTLRRVPRRK